MKKTVCIILAIVLAFSMVSCGSESAEKAADNALKAVKNLNIKGIEKYFGKVAVEDMDIGDVSADELKILKEFTSKMSWEIVGCEENELAATVTVDVTTVDLSPIVKDIAGELLGDAFSSLFGNGLSEEEMKAKALKIFEEKLSAKDVEMATNTIKLDMTNTEDGWKIELDDSIIGSFIGSFEDLLG